MDGFCERITRRAPDGRILRAGFDHAEPGWWPSLWGYYFGGTVYDEKSNRSLTASPPNIDAYEWMQSYPRRLGTEREQQFRAGFGNYDSPLNAFLAGKLAMVLQGPWLANVINTYKPDLDYAVAPFPVLESLYDPAAPIGLIDTDILVIPRGVRRPEACMEFIAFTQRRENVEALATAHCKNSPLAVSSAAFLADHPNRGVRVHDAIAKSPRSFLAPRTPSWLQFKAEFDAAAERMWILRGEPREVLAGLQQRTQAMLDRAADERRRRDAIRGGAA
jgi:multiple sugar transport system substrate-binding protein